jgi:CubicO group peptidase (beta-lactamase class C family)
MMFEPGTNWGYSHTNYVILGGVLEKIAGMPLNDAMQKYVFGPMGLTQTNGSKTPEVPEPALHTYSSEQREYLGIKPSLPFCPESTYWNPSWTTYDGALQTTDVTDMSKTMEAVGTGKVLSPSSSAAQTDHCQLGHAVAGCARPSAQRSPSTTAASYFGRVSANEIVRGSSATVGYPPAQKLTITVEVTGCPRRSTRETIEMAALRRSALAGTLAPDVA